VIKSAALLAGRDGSEIVPEKRAEIAAFQAQDRLLRP